MAQFAPVCPIQMLETMREQAVLGQYHLLLAHHVLEFPDRFTRLFEGHPQSTIIMDNSIVELGASEGPAKVLEAANTVRFARALNGQNHWVIPVLTDVMRDGEATREQATESYRWWQANAPSYPLMVVAQGNSWEDFCKTVDHFLLGNFPMIEYVGIPRKLVEVLGTRQLCIQYLEAVCPMINTHLLGFSDDVTDDVICANNPTVEGIDSAVPLRYAYSQTEDDDTLTQYTPTCPIPPRSADWFENGTFRDSDYRNLANIRKWVA